MRYSPDSEYDHEEVARLGAKPWQLELLTLNPSYCSWGPYEDYMAGKEDRGWASNLFYNSWQEFVGVFGSVNDLNEVVNFYFELDRDSKECETCDGNGYHPEAQEVVNTFYRHQNDRGISWSDKITQDELDALIEEGRIKPGAKLENVNAANGYGHGFNGFYAHDAINRHILIEARLKRLGIPKDCPTCDGHGHVFTNPEPHVNLVMWMLKPRKGCSHGIEVKNIQQADLEDVFRFLREARQRNHNRFSKIPG